MLRAPVPFQRRMDKITIVTARLNVNFQRVWSVLPGSVLVCKRNFLHFLSLCNMLWMLTSCANVYFTNPWRCVPCRSRTQPKLFPGRTPGLQSSYVLVNMTWIYYIQAKESGYRSWMLTRGWSISPSFTPDDLEDCPHVAACLYPRLPDSLGGGWLIVSPCRPDAHVSLSIVSGLNVLKCMIVVVTMSSSSFVIVPK
jgi:hypothetical protein